MDHYLAVRAEADTFRADAGERLQGEVDDVVPLSFAVEHAQTTTGDGNATFFSASGKVIAKQVSSEYDGDSWV